MSIDIFNIGLTGLNAAKIGLDTTGHNIANVKTPGYSRQEIVQSPAAAQETGSGFAGRGTQVDTIARQYNGFLQGQVRFNQSQASYYETYSAQISQIDNLIGDSSSGVSPALQGFFAAVQDVATDPSSVSARQSLLSNAEIVVGNFKNLDGQIQGIEQGLKQQIGNTIDDINGLGKKIADLNAKILSANGYGTQAPNDLLDQRDAAMLDLNKLIQASGTVLADGSMSVFIGTGQNLVTGNRSETLTTIPDTADPSQLNVAIKTDSSTIVLGSDTLPGGALGGLLSFKDQTLDVARNSLGKLAVGFAATFNAQHRLGQDLNGALGTNMFGTGQPAVFSNSGNTSNAELSASITDVNQLTNSDYQLTVQGGQYQVVRLSDKVSQTFATLPQTVDGVTIGLSNGAFAEGDQFLIQPTRHQAYDLSLEIKNTSLVAAASPIRTQQAVANTGTAAISAGNVVGDTTALPLTAPITLTYNAGTSSFDVTGTVITPTSFAYTAGSTVTLNGNLQFNINGTPKNGDQFTITANTQGTSDNRNGLALGQLQSSKTLDQANSTYQMVYSQMVSLVGSQSRTAEASSKSQNALLHATQQASQSVSGVNLDEEAARLLQYQQAYQAAGKLLQIASDMFQTILALGQ